MGNQYSEKHFGFFRGMVIQNNDPERRGRVKIFVPEFAAHLARDLGLPPERLEARFVGGSNTKNFLQPDVLIKLKNVIKWAEQAHPLIGSGTSGVYDAKNNIATVGEGHRGRNFEDISDDSITPSGESVAPKAPFSTHSVKGGFDIGYRTGSADIYNDVMAPTSYNNAAKGAFSIPRVGAQVWLFFENGSLDYPVYFGYVFDKNDWVTLFNPQDGNPDPHYPGGAENIEDSEAYMLTGKTVFNSKAGSLEFIDTDDFETIKISHYSGSSLSMSNHVTIETAVENKNTVVNEDCFLTVKGNYHQTINEESHFVYNGYVFHTYGDMDRKSIYQDWEETAKPAFLHASLFSQKQLTIKDPTKTGESKSGPNDTYTLPDKLTLVANWSDHITNMKPSEYIKRDQIKELQVVKG